ncbi:hypothetical protein [Arhodomonas sp. AD133]|uniref:hypothetical protein n=1 Tax=Arhodomonas sp. AD133 TaxID=3415009 RepID=UPI003EBFC188
MSNQRDFDPEDRNVRVSAQYVPIAAEFMAKGDVLYCLNGFLVEPHPDGGVLIVATNSHVMAVIHDTDGFANGTWICEAPAGLVKACRMRRKRPNERAEHLHLVGSVGYVTSADFPEGGDPTEIGPCHLDVTHAPPIDGRFLDWRKAIPAAVQPVSRISANSQYLRLAEEAAKAGGIPIPHVNLFPSGEGGAYVMRVAHMPEFVALVMPMIEDDTTAIPGWLRPAEPKAAA